MLSDLQDFLQLSASSSVLILSTLTTEKENVDFVMLLLILIILGWTAYFKIMFSMGSLKLLETVIYSFGMEISKDFTVSPKKEFRVLATSLSSVNISFPSTKVMLLFVPAHLSEKNGFMVDQNFLLSVIFLISKLV